MRVRTWWAGGRGVSVLLTAYLLTAVEAGLLAGGLVAVGGWTLSRALPVACVGALPLLPLQAWGLVAGGRLLARSRAPGRPRTRGREALVGLGTALGFVLTSPLVLIAGAVAAGMMLSLTWATELAGTADVTAALEDRARAFGGLEALPRWVVVATSGMLFAGYALLAVVWTALWASLRGRRLRPGLREGLAWYAPDRIHLVAGLVGGLTVGWLPSVIAETLASSPRYLAAVRAVFPGWSPASLEWLDAVLGSGDVASRVGMAVVVALLGPLAEELVFRGFLWSALERWANRWLVLGVTSLLFALAHLDPVHTPAVLLIGVFLGWLRLVSGSIVPSLVTHVVNNGLGAALALSAAAPGAVLVPDRLAWSLGLVTLALALLAWTARPTPGYRFG